MSDAIAQLRINLNQRTRTELKAQRRAAVLVVLIPEADGFELLLTRRTETLSSHRGQVAFPGGTQDATDESLTMTALREAFEEVALHRAQVEILGTLDDIPSITEGLIVTPIVGLCRERPTLDPNEDEVARIFTIPLTFLRCSENWRFETHAHGRRKYPIPFLDYDGETLWGLSAYVTRQLLQLMGHQLEGAITTRMKWQDAPTK